MYFHLILALISISNVYGDCSDLAIENDALLMCERKSKEFKRSKAQYFMGTAPIENEFGQRGEAGTSRDETSGDETFCPSESITYSCRTLGCFCLAFKKTSDENSNECILPDGQRLNKAVRREYRTLTDEERKRFHNAMWKIKQNGALENLVTIIRIYSKDSASYNGPGFLPWHREYLKLVEFALRRADHEVSLPFWDSTMDNLLPDPRDSIIWTNDFMGNLSDTVKFGSFAGWTTIEGKPLKRNVGVHGKTMSSADRDEFLASDDIDKVFGLPVAHMDKKCTSYRLFVGGDMEFIGTAAYDPIFYLLHSFVDQTWEIWRQTKQNRKQRETQYPVSRPECFLPYHNYNESMNKVECTFASFDVSDALENFYTDNLYEYQPLPNCPKCGESKYLFCHLYANKCASKIRLGGNCTGLESTDACYESVCYDEKCVTNDKDPKTIITYRLSNLRVSSKSCQDGLKQYVQAISSIPSKEFDSFALYRYKYLASTPCGRKEEDSKLFDRAYDNVKQLIPN